MKVAIYSRFSTDKDTQKQHSTERQQKSCLEYAQENRWDVVWCDGDDAVSGDADSKPVYESLQSAVQRGLEVDVLLVDELSRITRQDAIEVQQDLGWLRPCSVKVSCLDYQGGEPVDLENPEEVMMLSFRLYNANKELKAVARRSVKGTIQKFKNGKLGWMGPSPLGFDILPGEYTYSGGVRNVVVPSKLIANDDLQYVTEIFKKYLAGSSINALVSIMEKTNRAKTKGRFPGQTSVKQVLRNAIYCGKRTLGVRGIGKHATVRGKTGKARYHVNPLENSIEVQDYDVKKAVSFEEYVAVQKLLDKNNHRPRRRPATVGYKYSTILRCGNCGGAMHGIRYVDPRDAHEIISYQCASSTKANRKCKEERPYRKSVRESELDEILNKAFSIHWSQIGVHVNIVNKLVEEIRSKAGEVNAERKRMLAEIDVKEGLIESLVNDMGDDYENVKYMVMRQYKELSDLKKELQEKDSNRSGLLKVAEKYYKSKEKKKGLERYFAYAYELAGDIIEGRVGWDADVNKDWVEEDAEQIGLLRKMIWDSWLGPKPKDGDSGNSISYYEAIDGSGILPTFAPPEEMMKALKMHGLEEIKLYWTVGERRGRVANVVKSVELCMLLGDMNYTHIHVHQSSNQKMSIEVRTLQN